MSNRGFRGTAARPSRERGSVNGLAGSGGGRALFALTFLTSVLAASALTAAPLAPVDDRQDFAFADRGFLDTRADPLIKAADGHVVWDLNAYAFTKGPAPATANPSLWRQAQLLSRNGLYQVTEGVWQVRGFDISNATFIKGRTGWIVIDPLTSTETAKAALELANSKLGTRPVVALIYTHSHADHFGGARGMVDQADVDAGRVQVIAPEGFLEHAVSENVLAGPAMSRRAAYQFGTPLTPGPTGQLSSGIGMAVSRGTQSLIPPTVSIQRTGETLTVDGVRIEFQMTPGTEAPAEMNLYLPDLRALCMAENANATMHNVLTPRGALVRDSKAWADGLSESIRLYGDRTDVMFTSHAWPRFGRAVVADFLAKHRDAYEFLHDQTVRLMNDGLTGEEIGDRLALPPVLAREWYDRGYYGSLSFNARAVYQRYMGWYDANPVHLAPYPPAEDARRTVEAMGGPERVLGVARDAAAKGDDRWAAELLNRLVLRDAGDKAARAALAGVYGRLGAGSENALWRNMYLTAAQELTGGVRATGRPGGAATLDLIRNTPTPMLLDVLATRLNPAKAGEGRAVIDLVFPERRERFRVTVEHDVLTYETGAQPGAPDATLTVPRATFLLLALGGGASQLGAMAKDPIEGDRAKVRGFLSWFDAPRPDFPIVWREAEAAASAAP